MNENFTALQNEYANWLETLGFSNGLVYDFRFRIRDFLQWLQIQNINHIKDLTRKHITAYFDYLQTRPNKRRNGGLSISHLNHNFIAIDKFLEFLHQIGMETAPAPVSYRIKPDKQARINKIQPLTQQEIKELQGNIKNIGLELPFIKRERIQEQLKLVFVLYYACGLRRTEGQNLTIKDIDFDKKTIFIRQGKNYKDRIIPVNNQVLKALEHYIYNFRNFQKVKHNRLFLSTAGTQNNNLQKLQKITNNPEIQAKTCAEHSRSKLTLHILRHSIATHLLQNGMSIENIAKFLGHSTLDSTQIYTHIVNKI